MAKTVVALALPSGVCPLCCVLIVAGAKPAVRSGIASASVPTFNSVCTRSVEHLHGLLLDQLSVAAVALGQAENDIG